MMLVCGVLLDVPGEAGVVSPWEGVNCSSRRLVRGGMAGDPFVDRANGSNERPVVVVAVAAAQNDLRFCLAAASHRITLGQCDQVWSERDLSGCGGMI